MATFNLIGQVVSVGKYNDILYKTIVAENKYKKNLKTGKFEKISTNFFHCVSKFSPKCKKGDTIICEGIFESDEYSKYGNFVLKINHLGIISSSEDIKNEDCNNDNEENNESETEDN